MPNLRTSTNTLLKYLISKYKSCIQKYYQQNVIKCAEKNPLCVYIIIFMHVTFLDTIVAPSSVLLLYTNKVLIALL